MHLLAGVRTVATDSHLRHRDHSKRVHHTLLEIVIDATGSHHDLLVVHLRVVHVAAIQLLGQGRFALVDEL